MPDLGLHLGWVAQLLGAFATAFFATTVLSGRGRDFTRLAVASALVLLAAVLGAGWAVHPAAGLLLAFLLGWFDGGKRRWGPHLPLLGVAALSALAFITLGAGWLIYPLVVMGLFMAVSFLHQLGAPARSGSADAGSADAGSVDAGSADAGSAGRRSPGELPEHAGGQPVSAVLLPEAVPVAGSPAAAPPPAARDLLHALHQDARLPAEARALLVALDLRTAEAMRALHAQGQTGTQAAYQARAIREEYVPAAVQAYLKLPPTRADSVPIEDGKTGRDLLTEQLRLLLDAAQELLNAATQSGGQELLTHGRFLREKFGGKQDGDLKL